MAQATPENLILMALERTGGGRNKAGLWLAGQLRDNGYTMPDAENIMREYVRQIGASDYRENEALASLKSAYRYKTRQPWTTGRVEGNKRLSRRSLPEYRPREKPAEPSEKSMELLQKEIQNNKPFVGSKSDTYLQGRGIPTELAKACRVKHSDGWLFKDKQGKWNRSPAVVFPFFGKDGERKAAQGRRIEDWEGDTKITLGSKLLGIFSTPGALDSDYVAIVEAPIDAMTLALCGMPALAIGGSSGIPEWLITRLARPIAPGMSRTVYIATDADNPGDEAANKIGKTLQYVHAIRLRPPVKDWNEFLVKQGLQAVIDYIDQEITGPEPDGHYDRLEFDETTCQSDKLTNTVPELIVNTPYTPNLLTFYDEDELRLISGIDSEHKALLDDVKRLFGGRVVSTYNLAA